MKVLIADKFEREGEAQLAHLGFEVLSKPDLTPETLPQAVQEHDPHILIVRSTKVPATVFAAAHRLKLVIRAGAGYDTIDVAAASREGIYVANCPGKNAIAVAELAWALILSCDRRVPDQTVALRQGEWNKKEFSQARGLFGGTLGVLGLGTIGREVAARGLAFGMRVVAWSRSLTAEKADELGVEWMQSPLELARQSDVVSVHVAASAETENLINKEFLAALKPGTILVNTARGNAVDEAALADAVKQRGLRVGLDVYRNEPGGGTAKFQPAIMTLPGVYGTHHVGASTEQAQLAIAAETVQIAAQFKRSGEVKNCVNLCTHSSATCVLMVRHRNRPGVLARVFRGLSEASINVLEMENLLYEGLHAACARIQLSEVPNDRLLEELRNSCSDILDIDLNRMGENR